MTYADCGACGSAGSVRGRFCEVCYEQPRALRFSEVIAELDAIATLATSLEDGEMLAAACRRAERLLGSLKEQFHADLGLAQRAAGRECEHPGNVHLPFIRAPRSRQGACLACGRWLQQDVRTPTESRRSRGAIRLPSPRFSSREPRPSRAPIPGSQGGNLC